MIKPTGAKSWVLRTVVRGKRVDIGLGGLSYTPLQDARLKAQEFRSIARNGGDPRIKHNLAVPTFKELAELVYQDRLPTWKNGKHAAQWNTFPVPELTEKNKTDLARCAEDILLAREAHFPATIADLYKPDAMPDDLRAAHDRNDKVIEQIYIGRRFKNDTERLEHLFKRYTDMTTKIGGAA